MGERSEDTAESLTALGGKPASRLGQGSWAMFDWANQPYFTLITTFIFFPYFTSGFVGDSLRGQEVLGFTLGISGLIIAIASPVMGAIADATGPRKPWVFSLSVIYVLSCAALWYAIPGAPHGVWGIAALIILSGVTMEIAIVFNNAMLPSLAVPSELGRLSGYGWGLGYVGGLVALFIILIGFSLPGTMDVGFIPKEPLLGLSREAFEPERFTGPFSAAWYVLFVIPLFVFTPDQPSSGIHWRDGMRRGLRSLLETLKRLGSYKNVALFLFARMIYNDGLAAIFAFGGVFAVALFNWSITELGIFGIVLAIFASIGAFLGGVWDDHWGTKRTLNLSIFGLVLAMVFAISITPSSVLWVWDVAPRGQDDAVFSSVSELAYMVCGAMIGFFSGPAQAASRSMMARLAPKELVTEFFGLYALSGKATTFLAPMLIAVATRASGEQRASLYVIIVFLLIGALLLLPVKEERAMKV